jgi:hypothetical protein
MARVRQMLFLLTHSSSDANLRVPSLSDYSISVKVRREMMYQVRQIEPGSATFVQLRSAADFHFSLPLCSSSRASTLLGRGHLVGLSLSAPLW